MANAIKTNNVADNLVKREFEKYGPRKILLTDITYIPFEGRFCYLSTIIDAFTKEILSYVLSEGKLRLDCICHIENKEFRGEVRADINFHKSGLYFPSFLFYNKLCKLIRG